MAQANHEVQENEETEGFLDLEANMQRAMEEYSEPGNDANRPTIYKVPPSIRDGHDDAYDPKLVRIGPLHRHRSQGPPDQMEKLKWRYLNGLIQRSPKENSISKYVIAVKEKEEEARKQYSVEIDLTPAQFVEMLVLDGCFILEFLFKRATGNVGSPWKDVKWTLPSLRHDLLLLENQIPFFILQTLFEKTHNIPRPRPHDPNVTTPVVDEPLTLMQFALHYVTKAKNITEVDRSISTVHHLLHLHHMCQLKFIATDRNRKQNCSARSWRYVFRLLTTMIFYAISILLMCKRPRHISKKERDGAPRAIPSARRLKEAGVSFRRKKQDEGRECILNVSFTEDGELQIPFLSLQESSISYFRNLIAFEQCCSTRQDGSQYFTAYAIFMDQIIDTPEDVAILEKYKIVESKLGSDEEVAILFNGMCKGATLDYDTHYLKEVFQRVNDHCELDRNRWRAELVHGYFHNPWAVASIIVAASIVVFSGVQAVFSVLAYYHG